MVHIALRSRDLYIHAPLALLEGLRICSGLTRLFLRVTNTLTTTEKHINVNSRGVWITNRMFRSLPRLFVRFLNTWVDLVLNRLRRAWQVFVRGTAAAN